MTGRSHGVTNSSYYLGGRATIYKQWVTTFSALLSSWRPWENALHQLALLRITSGNRSFPSWSFSHNLPPPLETQGKAKRSLLSHQGGEWRALSWLKAWQEQEMTRLGGQPNKARWVPAQAKPWVLQIKHSEKPGWALRDRTPSKHPLLLPWAPRESHQNLGASTALRRDKRAPGGFWVWDGIFVFPSNGNQVWVQGELDQKTSKGWITSQSALGLALLSLKPYQASLATWLHFTLSAQLFS